MAWSNFSAGIVYYYGDLGRVNDCHTRFKRYVSKGNIRLSKLHFDFVVFILAFLVNRTRKFQDFPCGIEVVFWFYVFTFTVFFVAFFLFCDCGLAKKVDSLFISISRE